eukprot:TRINITY_DN95_c2_g1_i1.p2 TRINITY_DN95_c2_g1~~TRINITY_DN95_c2_g1_i1.p2  ORF type:complete len:273 (-),score=66.62 TRINITY_DN95_c2_g1_i1:1-819(-)
MCCSSKISVPGSVSEDISEISGVALSRLHKSVHKQLKSSNLQQSAVAAYLSAISFVDTQVGRLLEALRQNGLDKSTHIVLTSDHGFHLGEKQHWRKSKLWYRSTHVPLIFSGPNIAEGKEWTGLASLLDVFPTLTQLSNLPHLPTDGSSLISALSSPINVVRPPSDSNPPESVIVAGSEDPNEFGVYRGPWHLIQYSDKSRELYHLPTDREESANLINEKGSVAEIVGGLLSSMPDDVGPTSNSTEMTRDASVAANRVAQRRKRRQSKRHET